jgi:hypothetical protein
MQARGRLQCSSQGKYSQFQASICTPKLFFNEKLKLGLFFSHNRVAKAVSDLIQHEVQNLVSSGSKVTTPFRYNAVPA